MSNFQRPLTERLSKDFFSDPSYASVACAKTGPIALADNLNRGKGGEVRHKCMWWSCCFLFCQRWWSRCVPVSAEQNGFAIITHFHKYFWHISIAIVVCLLYGCTQEVFEESRSLLFKTLRVQRIYDADKNTVVYVSFNTRWNKDDDANKSRFKSSICAVSLE